MNYIRQNIKFVNILFLAVLLVTINQSLQNKHAHIFGSEIITHSHPLEKTNEIPLKNHQHTQAEIFFYSLISFDYYSHSGEQAIETCTIFSPHIYNSAEKQLPGIIWLCNTDSRDPPAGKC